MSESEALAGGGIDDFLRALAFSGGTTSAIVSASAALLGATAGLVGAFAVLRGRSLVTDAIGHATLPGVVGVFAVASWLGLDGRHPAATMLGAALSATAALFVLARLRDRDGIPVDAATSTALSGAFGLGIVLLSLVQGLHVPNSGGLDHLLFGQVATARASDLLWLAAVAVACLLVVLVTRHDLTTIAFDEVHARVTGVRVALLDRVLLALVFAVTVSALPVVGAVLVVRSFHDALSRRARRARGLRDGPARVRAPRRRGGARRLRRQLRRRRRTGRRRHHPHDRRSVPPERDRRAASRARRAFVPRGTFPPRASGARSGVRTRATRGRRRRGRLRRQRTRGASRPRARGSRRPTRGSLVPRDGRGRCCVSSSAWIVVDLVPLATALVSGCLCAALGNLLALHRTTMMADALSHSVVPGLVAGYVFAGAVEPGPMLVGGVVAGLVTARSVEWLRNRARVEAGAALGATFATLFAAGVVMIHAFDLENVELSVHHVLTGHLPTLIWFPPSGSGPVDLWRSLPPATRAVAAVTVLVVPLLLLFRKELVAAAFDRGFARTSGLRPRLLEFATYAAVSAAAVASFDSMGSILVVALFACPSAAARHLSATIQGRFLWSLALAALAVVAGYFAAAFGPSLLGLDLALAPAGTMACVAALVLLAVGTVKVRRAPR
ncbi:MAG: metal ABC transporter permease [Planctomycetota bacterium]